MSKLKGMVSRNDLEGGMLMVETDDGQRYQLAGELKGVTAGKRYELDGKIEKSQMGIGMSGPIFTVKHHKAI